MVEDPVGLLPRNKHDTERAQAIVDLGFPAVEPVLPQLLEWIQDINWPVALVLAPFLASIGRPLAPDIRRVFKADDYAWQDHLLQHVVAHSDDLKEMLRAEIERLALSPTPAERADGVDATAREVLDLG
jgi:hypothetical protein